MQITKSKHRTKLTKSENQTRTTNHRHRHHSPLLRTFYCHRRMQLAHICGTCNSTISYTYNAYTVHVLLEPFFFQCIARTIFSFFRYVYFVRSPIAICRLFSFLGFFFPSSLCFECIYPIWRYYVCLGILCCGDANIFGVYRAGVRALACNVMHVGGLNA